MKQLQLLINKAGLIILGALIKLNRLSQQMSQQALSEGICVPSYLSKIENGEVVPSLDIIELLFQELAIDYCQDYNWISEKKQQFQSFFEELKFNGFITSGAIFKRLEKEEIKLKHSPLIVEYYLVKLAYYSGTNQREDYNEAYEMLTTIETQLTLLQRYQFYFYRGIDQLYYYHNYPKAKHWLIEAKKECETGQVYEMLAIVNFKLGLFYDSFLESEKAFKLFSEEVNLVCLAGLQEFQALLAYKLGSLDQGLALVNRGMKYSKKINRQDLMLTQLLTKSFILWQMRRLDEMGETLLNFINLKKELKADWPVLSIGDLLQQCRQSNVNDEAWQDLYLTSQPEIQPAIRLIHFCLSLEKSRAPLLSSLIKDYQEGPLRHVIMDEIIEANLKEYYRQTRQYKEIALLFQPQMN